MEAPLSPMPHAAPPMQPKSGSSPRRKQQLALRSSPMSVRAGGETSASATSLLLELPDELLLHCALKLLTPSDVASAQTLTWACRSLHERLQPLRVVARARRHSLRWGVQHAKEDVTLCGGGRGLRALADLNWRRAYGRPLHPRGCSMWSVRIDNTRGSQGLILIGVSLLVHKPRGSANALQAMQCEWSVSPFYGRLLRRTWDMDGNSMLAAPPPHGYPDGHLMQMLVDRDGSAVRVEGRANGVVIEVVLDHEAGTLAFRLDGVEGPQLKGFPVGDVGMLLRPVIGFRWPEDQVTIRTSERLRQGWPQQDDNATRERDARGLQAARALRARLGAACADGSY